MFENRLEIEGPAVMRRVGKLEIALDLATRIDDDVRVEAGHVLAMSAWCSDDSSHMRSADFWYPIVMRIDVKKERKTVGEYQIVKFWKKDSDDIALVSIGMSNRPENNFEGKYADAIAWAVQQLSQRIKQFSKSSLEVEI